MLQSNPEGAEFGYFNLPELEHLNADGMLVERDTSFESAYASDVLPMFELQAADRIPVDERAAADEHLREYVDRTRETHEANAAEPEESAEAHQVREAYLSGIDAAEQARDAYIAVLDNNGVEPAFPQDLNPRRGLPQGVVANPGRAPSVPTVAKDRNLGTPRRVFPSDVRRGDLVRTSTWQGFAHSAVTHSDDVTVNPDSSPVRITLADLAWVRSPREVA